MNCLGNGRLPDHQIKDREVVDVPGTAVNNAGDVIAVGGTQLRLEL